MNDDRSTTAPNSDGRDPFTTSASSPPLPQHQALLDASGITPEVAAARGYRSVTDASELEALGFADYQQIVPALLVPVYGVDGEIATYQSRPDAPRVAKGKPIKYETPAGSRMALDVPPMIRKNLDDPSVPLYITEGVRKADSAVSFGYTCIDLLGVNSWRGKNAKGGLTALADWNAIAFNGRQVYLVFDSDVMVKDSVQKALASFKVWLESKRVAAVYVVQLPAEPDEKVGLDDYLSENGREDFEALCIEARDSAGFSSGGPLTENLTDVGDANRFAARYRGVALYSPNLKSWLGWEPTYRNGTIGGRWVEDVGDIKTLNLVKAMVRSLIDEAKTLNDVDRPKMLQHIYQCESIYKIVDILKAARLELPVDIRTFDANDWLLNTRNGVVDLTTFEFRSAQAKDRCRWQADVDYIPKHEDTLFMRLWAENIPNEETRAFAQEVYGYTLTGDRSAEKFFFIYGPKRSGNTTANELARVTLGDYAAVVPAEFFMTTEKGATSGEANTPVLASLVGKRLVIAAEGNKSHKFNEAFMKHITGGEAVKAMPKFGHPFEYKPKFVPLIHGNTRPEADYNDSAFPSRIIELPFAVGRELDQVDESLKTYLLTNPSARSAWLNWALEGLR